MNKNKQYWEDRQIKLTEQIDKRTDKQIKKQLLTEYKKSLKEINAITDELYRKYSDGSELSISELYKYDRYKQYQAELTRIINDLGTLEQSFTQQNLLDVYTEVSNKTIDEIKQRGINISFTKISAEQVNKSMNYPWSGADYSSRIWDNKKKLITNLQQTVTKGIIEGKSNTAMAKDLKARMDKGAYECRRLVRTETQHIVNSATHDTYSKAGINKVEILVSGNDNMCDECMELDGKIWDIDDAPMLPMHANCSCCLSAVIE